MELRRGAARDVPGRELSVEKNAQAFRLLADTVAKLGDKPVPTMLKKLLTVEPADRWSCAEALRSAAFAKLPPVAEPRRIAWPPLKDPPAAPAKPATSGKAAPIDREIAKHCTVLEFGAKTERAARAYAAFIPDRPDAALHAVLLASRLGESEMIDLTELDEWDECFERFDLDAYMATEKVLLEALDYCLLLPPPPAAGDAKRRKCD